MKKRLVLLLALLAALQSCVKDIYLDAGEVPKVVVECVLTEDPVQELYLSYTKGVSQKEADQLLDAKARLLDLDLNDYSDTFSYAGDGKWQLDYSTISGHRYKIEIHIPGNNLITAETRMPAEFASSLVSHHPLMINLSLELLKKSKIGFSSGSYYWSFPDHCWIYFINDDGSIAETICTDYPDVDDFNLTGKEYIPEKGPKKPVFEGWTETEEGIESVWGEAQDSFLYPTLKGQALHDRFLRISKGREFSTPWDANHYPTDEERAKLIEQYYSISGSFKVQGQFGTLCIESLSEEYDIYLAAAMRADKLIKSTDISKIYLRENILDSNIQGGLGIFGAKVSRHYKWSKSYSNKDYPMR